MKKRKIFILVLSLVLTLAVGSTLAWFTSKDEIINIFASDKTINSGINVEENFPGSAVDSNGTFVRTDAVMPGINMTKEVWVESKANYDQFVRARVVKEFVVVTYTENKKVEEVVNYYKQIYLKGTTLQKGTTLEADIVIEELNGKTSKISKNTTLAKDVVLAKDAYIYKYFESNPESGYTSLDVNNIQVNFVGEDLSDDKDEDETNGVGAENANLVTLGWIKESNGIASSVAGKHVSRWYYYNATLRPHSNANHVTPNYSNGILTQGCKSTNLIESTKLVDGVSNAYANLTFNVRVEAQSVQAVGKAGLEVWENENIPDAIENMIENYVEK